MKMHLKSINPSIWRIVEKGYDLQKPDDPTKEDDENKHKNAQAANSIPSALSGISHRSKALKEYLGYQRDNFNHEGFWTNANGRVVAKYVGLRGKSASIKRVLWVPKALEYIFGGRSWAIDSGCTNHMIGEESMFSYLDPNGTSQDNIVFEDDGKEKRMSRWETLIGAHQPAKNVMTTIRPLDLLNMDLFGPIAYLSNGGNKYGLAIVDNFSCFTWVFFFMTRAKHKQVKKFARRAQNEFELKIKNIRNDNGKEFKNKCVESFLDEEVISMNSRLHTHLNKME
uniref:Polyprotein n=1 Tax=Oryza sativa subsp. japonica TaxID=39947 RepID=Q8W5C3_ORYSJ|nr:putative polyprotein [Oryza sativa Japonica Group]